MIIFLLLVLLHGDPSSSKVVHTKYPSSSTLVYTNSGRILGKKTPEARIFLGVPYASPPGRWEYAKPPRPWRGRIWDARWARPMCIQPPCGNSDPPGVCLDQMSEDCLYLNIFVPTDAEPGGNKSVMFFLHGGAFTSYTGGSELFNGERMANKGDVIVVTINYRLGALGFLVTGATSGTARGNYALADQRLALLWVRQNINYFGGNPNNVTMFGQSAGAQSVGIHLISRKVDSLFHKAIMQSSPFTIKFRTFDQAVKQGEQFAANLKCPSRDLNCMRRKSPMEIIDAQRRTTIVFDFLQRFQNWGPHLDGDEVPLDLLPAFERGIFDDKPILMGNTAEEGIGYIYGAFSSPVSRLTFTAILMSVTPRHAFNILPLYNPSRAEDARPEFAKLATDLIFICPSRKIAKLLMRYTNTWMYIFDHDLRFLNETQYLPYCIHNACHGSELPYLFQTAHRANFNLSFEDIQLSDEMLIYWTNFAKYGNPNGGQTTIDDEPRWPMYTSYGNNTLASVVFQQPMSIVENDYNGLLCDALDKTNYLIR